MQDVAISFRVGISTEATIVYHVCSLLWRTLQPLYLNVRNEPLYMEAGTYSIVLMAAVDSNLKFICVDVGAYGRDGGTLSASCFGKSLEKALLGLPSPKQLPGTNIVAPHVFVGDEAFQLRPDFLRSYYGRAQDENKRFFNYRLSRARRCVENAFGVIASRFRFFRRAINLQPQNADYVVMACCVLHNFLRDDVIYMTANYVDSEDAYGNITSGQWRTTQDSGTSAMFSLQPSTGHNYTRTAAQTRDLFCSYFVSREGSVPWQRASAGLRP
ncbi:hypothetical protein HPB49_019216 [Dermacentor silvarum]|uniref:Uncharacterized protein n=1 Tax=Dermacentor silvarum TaxID=543639 RepID=A0ACB8E2F4_DERSI|nr:hypothetical protein HPB49_019216 [Dermacentor silvarum]